MSESFAKKTFGVAADLQRRPTRERMCARQRESEGARERKVEDDDPYTNNCIFQGEQLLRLLFFMFSFYIFIFMSPVSDFHVCLRKTIAKQNETSARTNRFPLEMRIVLLTSARWRCQTLPKMMQGIFQKVTYIGLHKIVGVITIAQAIASDFILFRL